jgi:hypothetical protein
MRRPAARHLLRDLIALALLVALATGGYLWHRSVQAAKRWHRVTRQAEGFAFRIPPDWAATPLGYADGAYRARQPGGVLLQVRTWAIPREIRALPGGERSPEATALDAWAERQRAGAFGAQRLLDEERLRIDGARAILQLFEDPRTPYPYLVVAAAAREGRLYTFSTQVGRGVEPDDAVGTVRRILRTAEWLPRAPAPLDGGVASPLQR